MNPAISSFAGTARDFCQWFEGTVHELASARRPLLLLLLQVSELPPLYWPAEDEPARRTHEQWQQAMLHISDFSIGYYRTVFDPLDLDADDEPTHGNACDDLADIYGDLSHGLAAYDRGQPELASAVGLHGYGFEWGQHAASLLKAVDSASRGQG